MKFVRFHNYDTLITSQKSLDVLFSYGLNQAFRSLSLAYKVLLILAASSASAERVFSKVKCFINYIIIN